MIKSTKPPIEQDGFVVQYRNPGELEYHAMIAPSVIKITSQGNTPYYFKLYFNGKDELVIEGEIPLTVKPLSAQAITVSFA